MVNGKGDKQRTCIIPRPALDALGAYLQGQGSGYVFEGRHQGHISTRQIQRLLDEIAEDAGLQETRPGKVRQRKKVTPHLLRHSFSRWTLDAGMGIANLSAAARACIAEHHGHLSEGAALRREGGVRRDLLGGVQPNQKVYRNKLKRIAYLEGYEKCHSNYGV